MSRFLAPEQRQAALDKAKEEKSWPTSASWRTAASPGSAHGNAKPSWSSCDKRLEKTTSQDTHVVLVPAAKFGLNFEMSIQSRTESSKELPRCRDGKLLVLSQVLMRHRMVPLTTSKIGCPIPSNLIAAKALVAGEGFVISTYSISEALAPLISVAVTLPRSSRV